MTRMAERRKYRPSTKREVTSEQVRQRIMDSAWTVFSRQGLDASTISEIVAASGSSTGSFYNHYRTKQAVFEEIISDFVKKIRSITASARSKAGDLDTMLQLSYKDLLDHIVSVEGARSFIARNQHHVRAKLYGLDSTSGLLDDIRSDVVRGMPGHILEASEISLIASLIVSNGIESLLLLDGRSEVDTSSLAELMTRLIINGINGLAPPIKT